MSKKNHNYGATVNDEVHCIMPHRPPSDAAVKAATAKYVQQEKDGKLDTLRSVTPTHQRY
jgi:hypothetical protein